MTIDPAASSWRTTATIYFCASRMSLGLIPRRNSISSRRFSRARSDMFLKNFSVTTMTVKAGDTILFKNDDPVVHNIFAKSDVKTFNVTQNPGEETPITTDAAGTFVVRCAIHPKMKLTVKVE